MTASEYLRRKADDYRALGQEHESEATGKLAYEIIELILRELAEAMEHDAETREAA